MANSSKKNRSKLEKSQKKAVRNVFLKNKNEHTDPLFKKGKILKLEEIYELNKIKFLADARDEALPDSIMRMFKIDNRTTRRNTENSNFKINNVNVKNYLRYDLPKVWNNMDSIKKEYSKQMLVDSYKSDLFFELEELLPYVGWQNEDLPFGNSE